MDKEHIFLGCKHKHMLQNAAPLDKIELLYNLLPMECHGFKNIIDF